MKTIDSMLVAVVVAGLAGSPAGADEKIDKAKLIGNWKLVKIDGNRPPTDVTVEYTKDGKIAISLGKDTKVEGTYSVEGDKLSSTMKMGDKEEKDTQTITTLTDEKLVVTKADGKKLEWEKAKK